MKGKYQLVFIRVNMKKKLLFPSKKGKKARNSMNIIQTGINAKSRPRIG